MQGGRSYDALASDYVGQIPKEPHDTPFDKIDQTFQSTQLLCNRVFDLVHRLAGVPSANQPQAVPVSSDNGLLASVRTSAILTRSVVMDAIAEISRLERELP